MAVEISPALEGKKMDQAGMNRLSEARSRGGVRMAVCGAAGATILGLVGAVVYGWVDSAKGQMAEGATAGACLGVFVGGVVGLITGSLTRDTIWRTVGWAVAGGLLLAVALGVMHYHIDYRSRPGVRSSDELFGDIMLGIFMGLTFGGILAAGICILLMKERLLAEEARSRIEFLRYVHGLEHTDLQASREPASGLQRGGPVSLPPNQVEK